MVDLLATFPANPEALTRASALRLPPGDLKISWMPAICMSSMVIVTSHCQETGLPLMNDSSIRIEPATRLLGRAELASLPSTGGRAASDFRTHSKAWLFSWIWTGGGSNDGV
eukprot:1434989-Heterocapsa_arctica.AAC.1